MEQKIITLLRQFIAFRTVAGENEVKKKCLEWVESVFFERVAQSATSREALRLSSLLRTTPEGQAGQTSRLAHSARSLEENETGRAKKYYGAIDGAPYLYLPHPNPKLLWFAHIDVVPADDHQFSLIQKEDNLIGRGTADMKGNQLPFLMALRDAFERGDDPPISVLLTSDEETAGQTIPKLLEEGIIKNIPVAFTPDCGPKIVCEHKGVVWADLLCHGKGCHAAYPWAGENPLFILAEALLKIRKAFPPEDEEEWRMTVTPTDITGSDARNQIPESASAKIDIRFTPDSATSADAALDLVKNILPPHCTLTTHLAASHLRTDPQHPMVQIVKKIAEEVTGEAVPICREPGGTDARYFGEKGIAAFLYGVEGGGIHGKDEWVSLQSLMLNYEISNRLIHALL